MVYTTAGVKFPSLKHLELGINYPYADDTLFRGNSLDYLKLTHDDDLFDMLANLDICTQVQFIEIVTHFRCGSYSELSKPFVVPAAFIKRFSSSLTRLCLNSGLFESYNFNVELHLARLQILHCTTTTLGWKGIMLLLKNCPHLTHLTCRASRYDDQNISPSMVKSLINENYPLNSNFWYLSVTTKHIQAYDISTAILLAVLCPNFSYIDVDDANRQKFNSRIDYWIEKCNLAEYAETINRIKFKEPAASSESSDSDDYIMGISDIF
ncbi:hypothetical protein BX667DRAFT_494639 [Coemansia mojavensis]|nr:hypothetical protein BX667DRAFT_494639 [Coemansia mojavensis]